MVGGSMKTFRVQVFAIPVEGKHRRPVEGVTPSPRPVIKVYAQDLDDAKKKARQKLGRCFSINFKSRTELVAYVEVPHV